MRNIGVTLALLLSVNCLVGNAANLTGAALSKAIVDAKIVAPGYRVNAVIFPDAHEVVVSTYTNAASKDITTDCKVDALLIARKVTETAPQTVRVKVRFYELDQINYREVVVTKPEIAAFTSGAVKKDDLLNSLEVVSGSGTGKSERKSPASETAPTPARTSYSAQQGDKYSLFRKNGLMFYYPKSWGAKDMTNQWGDFVELINNHTCWESIIFRLQDKESALEAANDEDKYYWSSHQHVQVQAPRAVLIGQAKNIEALVYYIKDKSNPADQDRFEKHFYFGYKHRIYSISVRFCRNDQESINADLNTILATIVRE
jgi:hypothetical protein